MDVQYKHCCHVDDCVYALHEWGLGYFISTFWTILNKINFAKVVHLKRLSVINVQVELQTIHSFVLFLP